MLKYKLNVAKIEIERLKAKLAAQPTDVNVKSNNSAKESKSSEFKTMD